MDDVPRFEPAEFVRLVGAPAAAEQLSVFNDVPVVVVVFNGAQEPPHSTAEAVTSMAALSCVLVALVEHVASVEHQALIDSFDVVLAEGGVAPTFKGAVAMSAGRLQRLLAKVNDHPIAAVSLALLLRQRYFGNVPAGLVAESAVFSALLAGQEFAHWRAHYAKKRFDDRGPRVRVQREEDSLEVVLSRPRRHNALDSAMRAELCDALLVAVADPRLAVTLIGDGPSFCSGGDLDEFGTSEDPGRAHVMRLTQSPARLLHSLSARVRVVVHGQCLGAGAELSAFAGRVSARADAAFSLPEIGLGLIPGAGGTVSIPRRIGAHRTAYLAITGDVIDAHTAAAWGLVDEIIGQ